MQTATDKTAAQVLATPVQFLKGVGPQRGELLRKLGLETARDVLFFFPRDYQDASDVRSIAELEDDKLVSVLGTVEEVDLRDTGNGRSMLGVLLRQEHYYLRAMWFNQPFMREKFKPGQRIMLSGSPQMRGGRWEMVHPRFQEVETEADARGQILPIYPLTEGLAQGQVRGVVRQCLEQFTEVLEEVFPDQFLDEHQLWPIKAALPQIHFPVDAVSLEQARRRFVYQELFVLQLALALRKQSYQTRSALALPLSAKIDSRIRRLLPFTLTEDQDRAVGEIAEDLAKPQPMNRMLQGEVGSGKTAVAVYAMLLAIAHGGQAALMAPTELLARQHFDTLSKLLAGSQVRLGLLTSALSGKPREELMKSLAAGEIDLLIGTQAIVRAEAQFARLALVVIDEQHRFGVRQRASLKSAGEDPHYLVMTATPIPRTVSLTLFGDLDTSAIRHLPPGRQPVNSYLAKAEEQARWWEFFRKKLAEGRQGYVVTPLVEESQQTTAASLQISFESLANGELEAFRLDLVHGRMKPAEKAMAMERFHSGVTQVLVATSVIEVGIDVPNATVMTVLDAERFGLAQLHQLRGRVGRGSHPGYCCLFSDAVSDNAQERLQAWTKTTDGFQLAELDFQLRGPGDLFGTRQHGLPPLRIADLQRDAATCEQARQDAKSLVAADPGLASAPHERLRRMVLGRYGKALALGDVG